MPEFITICQPTKKNMSRINIEGDSLSDRAKLKTETVAGVPLGAMAGLGASPEGRFSDGKVWSDFISEKLANQLCNNTGITNPNSDIDLTNPDLVELPGTKEIFVRSYCVGGMTAHNYQGGLSLHPAMEGARAIVSALDEQTTELLKEDLNMGITADEKSSTLTYEWTGANDLVTVNTTPSVEAVENAIKARLNNIHRLFLNGYSDFFLFNLPDLSLTPRFQTDTVEKRQEIQNYTQLFNKLLLEQAEKFKEKFPKCKIRVFDTFELFTDLYNNPTNYGFDPSLKSQCFIDSESYQQDKSSPDAENYIFWNDVHPTEKVQQLIAEKVFESVNQDYHFIASHQSCETLFRQHYGKSKDDAMASCCGFFKDSKFPYQTASLKDILKHGLIDGGARTLSVMKKLGWVNSQNQIISTHPKIIQAAKHVNEELKLMSQAGANVVFETA